MEKGAILVTVLQFNTSVSGKRHVCSHPLSLPAKINPNKIKIASNSLFPYFLLHFSSLSKGEITLF